MGIGRLIKSGMIGGLAGAVAKNAGVSVGDIARHGGLGIAGLMLAKKKKRGEAGDEDRPATGGRGDVDAMMGRSTARSTDEGMKRGGKAKVKKMAKGGSTASKRADGCAQRGKTKGRFV
jgi:hypothetical protein